MRHPLACFEHIAYSLFFLFSKSFWTSQMLFEHVIVVSHHGLQDGVLCQCITLHNVSMTSNDSCIGWLTQKMLAFVCRFVVLFECYVLQYVNLSLYHANGMYSSAQYTNNLKGFPKDLELRKIKMAEVYFCVPHNVFQRGTPQRTYNYNAP